MLFDVVDYRRENFWVVHGKICQNFSVQTNILFTEEMHESRIT